MTYEHAVMYIVPFVSSFCVSAVLCYVLVRVTAFVRVRDRRTDERHIHAQDISRFGGVAMIIAFISTLAWDAHLVFDHHVWAIVCGSILILLFGIGDDIKPFSWKTQIFFQTAIVLLVFIFGVRIAYISNPLGGVMWLSHGDVMIGSLLFMLVWVIIIMNAINWIDGIDGLSGGVVSIAAITIFALSLQPMVMQPPIAIIAIALCGAVIGFLTFNFPRAYILAGSSGAFFMGFILAILAIGAGAKIGTTLMVLAVPLVDAVWVVVTRLRKGQSIFVGDSTHLHHRLLSRGWTVRRILFLYYGITIAGAFVAVNTQSLNKLITFIVLCVMITAFFVILDYDARNTVSY